MNIWQKTVAGFLATLMVLSLAACDKGNVGDSNATTTAATTEATTTTEVTGEATTSDETETTTEPSEEAATTTVNLTQSTTAKNDVTTKKTTTTTTTKAVTKATTTTTKAAATTTKATTTTTKATTTTTKATQLTFDFALEDADWECAKLVTGQVYVMVFMFKDEEWSLGGYGDAAAIIGSQAAAEAEYQKDPSPFVKYNGKLYASGFGDGGELSYTQSGNTITVTIESGTLVLKRIANDKLEVVSNTATLSLPLEKGDIVGCYTGKKDYND